MNRVMTGTIFTIVGLGAITSFFGSASKPSPSHLLVRAKSENEGPDLRKPRLTKHPSGAFVPKPMPEMEDK
eukprot:CAMPEP_0115885692 /NCGR_PEP_ID=MMETSP0287-20121206/30810_1 /TAXON_ID=412157 /ORGANISM="Chrysochromulina rotalis, Strain UIO044" /LENGTH=70 /DNA_ID=CAMNT_0003342127 /DNA_START=132 /DNA_END=344 /DNA_ORIENTATION=-